MERAILILFYLFLLLLPTQLGRHFSFNFSSIQGLRSDYLTPTFYLTDLIILSAVLLTIYSFLNKKSKFQFSIITKIKLGSAVLLYLFINSIAASNKWIAVYEDAKILEYILFGLTIIMLKPKLRTIINILSINVLYTSFIGFWQFFLQRSIGGLFWFLGERTFYVSTPGVANVTFAGEKLLRPYSVFPHPNVFGGFLAVVLPLVFFVMLYEKQYNAKKIYYILTILVGLLALFLIASRASWLIVLAGFIMVILENWRIHVVSFFERKQVFLILFYFFILVSVFIPLFLNLKIANQSQSLNERRSLIKATIGIIPERPFIGQGLGNSTAQIFKKILPVSGVYAFQPVHNIYLLILMEAGIWGFLLFLTLLTSAVFRSTKKIVVNLALISICGLGFFDHYLITLQQGQLILLLFLSLAYT